MGPERTPERPLLINKHVGVGEEDKQLKTPSRYDIEFSFFFFLFFFFSVGSKFPAPHLSLKLSFPVEPELDTQHRDNSCEVRMGDLAKPGHTHTHNPSFLSRPPLR